nr:hypothetical protein [Tanacetum cinerariifolium]
NGVSSSGKKKQAGLTRKDVSNSNPYDALNTIENEDELGTNVRNSKLAKKEKLVVVDEDGKSLKKIDDPINTDTDREVNEVFNETLGLMASTSSKVKKSGMV